MPGLFVIIAFLIMLSIYRRWRTRREELAARWQLRLSAVGFAQREFRGPVKLHPWTPDLKAYVYIEPWPPLGYAGCKRWPAGKRWVTVRISGPTRLGDSGLLVDFGFGCDLKTAERLQERIRQWMASAQQGETGSHE